eukprot:363590-Chlamydomonas_euryale.AAC.8
MAVGISLPHCQQFCRCTALCVGMRSLCQGVLYASQSPPARGPEPMPAWGPEGLSLCPLGGLRA